MAGPTLTAPSDAATGVSLTPSFTWGAVSGASVYQVQIALASDFAEPVLDREVAASPLALSSLIGDVGYPLDFGRAYYWRARAKVTGAWGDWSAVRSFTVLEGLLAYTPQLDHKGAGLGDLLEQFKERG
jgi:hypothetical protein